MVKNAIEEALAALEAEEPGVALRSVADLRGRLDGLEARAVERAIAAGSSWRQVAAALGVTKQAAHKKHARRIAAALMDEEARAAAPSFYVSGRARRAVRLARDEARAQRHAEVRPEHLVVGLLRDEGPVGEALTNAGVSLERARAAAAVLEADRREKRGPIPVARETGAILEESLREAVRLGAAHLGSEHLLAVALQEPGGAAAAFVRDAGGDAAEAARLLHEALQMTD